MKNKLQKIGTILLNIILVLIVIITIMFMFGFIQMKRTNSKYINLFGYSIMQVVSGSMSDTINIKDIIIVKVTKQVEKDDIVTYEQNDSLITHRIISIEEDYLVTKGDANNTNDEPISKNDIIGKVVFIIPKIGIWQKVLTSPQVIISSSITICLLYLVITSKDKRKEECVKED